MDTTISRTTNFNEVSNHSIMSTHIPCYEDGVPGCYFWYRFNSLRSEFGSLSEEVAARTQTFNRITADWNKLGKDDQQSWIDVEEDKDVDEEKDFEEVVVETPVAPVTKKMTGLILYLKEQMFDLKEEITSGTDRLTRIGRDWKGMSDEDKKVWNDRASAL